METERLSVQSLSTALFPGARMLARDKEAKEGKASAGGVAAVAVVAAAVAEVQDSAKSMSTPCRGGAHSVDIGFLPIGLYFPASRFEPCFHIAFEKGANFVPNGGVIGVDPFAFGAC